MAKKKKLTVEDWRIELEHAKSYRRLYGSEDNWPDLEAIFNNVHDSQLRQGPNLVFSVGDTLLSELTVPRPYIQVKPESLSSVVNAPVLQSIDNKLVKQMGMQEEAERASLHAYLFGVGIKKFGYDSEWGWADSGISQLSGGLGDDLGMSLSQYDKTGKRKVEFNNIKPGMPWTASVLPQDFLVPWGTPPDLNKAPWVAHRIVRHVDDIKGDVKYRNTRDLQPNMSIEDFVKSYQRSKGGMAMSTWQSRQGSMKGKGADYVEMWEIHDRATKRVLVMAEGHDKFLRDDEDLLQINGQLPFVAISLTPRVRTFWSSSFADYLLPSQAELTDISVQAMKHRRTSVLKMIVQGGIFSEHELERLLSSDVGAVAVSQPGANIRDAVVPFTPSTNPLVREEGEHVRRDAREMVGVSRNNMGELDGKTHITATQTLKAESGTDLRRSRLAGQVSKLYLDGIKVVNGIIQEYWRMPQVTQVMGEDGRQRWVEFRNTDLQGDFDFSVSLIDESSRAQIEGNALNMYLTLSQDPTVNPVALRQYLISQVNRPEFSNIFTGQGSPQGQQGGNPPQVNTQQGTNNAAL
jgi:hypothetical protein